MSSTRQPPQLLFLLCIFLLSVQTSAAAVLSVQTSAAASVAVDKFEKGQNLTDGRTLVSSGGASYTLGFFSPGTSTKRYLGIWFTVSNDTVYWIANRDRPIDDKSGVLLLNDDGSQLVLLDGSRRTMVWSANFVAASAAVVQLQDTGNLVVRNGSSDAYMWHSFDHPSDTLLPGMKMGKSLWSGEEWSITAWRSADDPSPGDYRRVLSTEGLPELVLWQRDTRTYRTGPWNGKFFNGVPEASNYSGPTPPVGPRPFFPDRQAPPTSDPASTFLSATRAPPVNSFLLTTPRLLRPRAAPGCTSVRACARNHAERCRAVHANPAAGPPFSLPALPRRSVSQASTSTI